MPRKVEELVAYSANVGNLHSAANYANELGWAKYLVTAQANGFNGVVLFVLPKSVLEAAKAAKRVW